MDYHVLKLDLNHKRNAYTCGDIHGRFDLLDAKLKAIGFDPSQDVLIAVGDLVDRGQHSHRSLEYLHKDWFYSVLGNHEDMVINGCFDGHIAQHHRKYGGEWFYHYSEDEQAVFAGRFLKLPIAIEAEFEGLKFGFVHADVQGDHWDKFTRDLIKSSTSDLKPGSAGLHAIWSRKRIKGWFSSRGAKFNKGIRGIDQVYVGHTIFDSPFCLQNINYIDTGAFMSDQLTLLRLGTPLPAAKTFHPEYSRCEDW